MPQLAPNFSLCLPPVKRGWVRCMQGNYIRGEVVTTGRRVERTLFDGLLTDKLVQLLLFEVEQLIVARRHSVDELILHVKLRHCKHCMRTTNT